MNGLFTPNSRFMRYLNRLADLMILNLLFLLTSIPIFTIGASLTALYSVCFRLGTDREGSTFRDYFAAFKENFRQATSLFLLLLLWLMGTGGAAVIFCFMAGWMHCLFVPFAVLFIVVVLVASLMTALIYASVGPKTFANERVKELQLSAEVVSSYYLQYQSEEMTLREFERALSMSGVITDSQMQVFNGEGKLIMRSTDDRPAKFLLKGQSDNILELIRTSVQTVLENGYTVIETHDLNEEIGEIYTGKVTKIMTFGAFVEFLPGKEGLVHISKLDHKRVEKVEDVVHEGDEIVVKLVEIDKQGRLNLSRKDALPKE